MLIPNVEFSPRKPGVAGIELLDLKKIYNAQENSDHDPGLPHRVEFNGLMYITQGTGQHFIDFNHYPIKPGNFIFIQKNQVQAFDFNHQPQGFIVLFTDDFLTEARTNIRLPTILPNKLTSLYNPVINLENSAIDSFQSLLMAIADEQSLDQPNSLLIQLLFSSLLIKVMREIPHSPTKRLSEVRANKFNHFIRMVEDRSNLSRDATDYAHQLGMTYKSLNEICKLASGKTAKQLIDIETVLEAKRKLAVEQIQVQTLAYELGFDEVTNFVKYFKKHTHLTPSQFKQNLKG